MFFLDKSSTFLKHKDLTSTLKKTEDTFKESITSSIVYSLGKGKQDNVGNEESKKYLSENNEADSTKKTDSEENNNTDSIQNNNSLGKHNLPGKQKQNIHQNLNLWFNRSSTLHLYRVLVDISVLFLSNYHGNTKY